MLRLYGGECWVIWWGVLGYIGEVLGYMVGSWVTWWSIGLHGGECYITWGMLDYMQGSVGLPGDSPIRERLFNTGWVGGVRNVWSMIQRKLQPPFVRMKKSNPHPLTV